METLNINRTSSVLISVYHIDRNKTQSNATNASDLFFVNDWPSLYVVLTHLAPFYIFVDRYITPIWCVIGFVGNILSVRIWTLRGMRKCNTSASYLATLAISDFIFLILIIGHELQYPWNVGALDLQGWCQLWNVLHMSSQYVSLLLVFAFTVERFISVCRPFHCEKLSKTSRSSKIITGIIFLSILLATPQAVFWSVSSETGQCAVRNLSSETFSNTYIIWSWASELVMFGAVPIVAFILNVCVLKQIRTVRKLYATSDTFQRHVTGTRCTSTTATLMWISFYLIFSKLPVTIMFTIQSRVQFGDVMSLQDMSKDPSWNTYLSYLTARKIIEELGISHHACNIFIYAATSKQFGLYLKLFLCQMLWCKHSAGGKSPVLHHHHHHHHIHHHHSRQRQLWLHRNNK